MKLTATRIELFLADLSKHGIVVRAAAAASPHTKTRQGAARTFRDLRNRDPKFARRWDDALEAATAEVEMELHRRAVLGWDEPVYQRGERVGTVRKYSDRLLELRAKALMPNYRDRSTVDSNLNLKAEDRPLTRAEAEALAERIVNGTDGK